MKTVSLSEALASGKKIRIKRNDKWLEVFQPLASDAFTMDQILHAECQIIEEPREIWVWEKKSDSQFCDHYFNSKDALEPCYRGAVIGRPVKFREVCDE